MFEAQKFLREITPKMKLFVVMEMKKGTIHVGSRGWFSARHSFLEIFATNKVYVVSCFYITTNNFILGVIWSE